MNPKQDAVLELARRYDYDPLHAHQVECLAGTLFMELESLHLLGREDRKLLEYASILHDIGYFISSKSHHRHTLQLIMMEPLPAFSRSEKLIVANIARYHRKAVPSLEHTAYALLTYEERRRVDLLIPLLRIADALDRTHAKCVQELSCRIQPEEVIFQIGARGEANTEVEALRRAADLFRTVYGREPIPEVVHPRLLEMKIEAKI